MWLNIRAASCLWVTDGPPGTETRRHEIILGGSIYIPPSLDIYLSLPPTMTAVTYRQYTGEPDLPHIISLVEHELSEPYVIYTYRYFLNQWYAFPPLPRF